jgi:hypothetical protein
MTSLSYIKCDTAKEHVAEHQDGPFGRYTDVQVVERDASATLLSAAPRRSLNFAVQIVQDDFR